MKLSSLLKFIDDCGGNSILTGLTTSDVYNIYRKKAITIEFDIAEIFVSFSNVLKMGPKRPIFAIFRKVGAF